MLDVGEFSSRTAPVIAIPLTVFPGIGTAVNVATEVASREVVCGFLVDVRGVVT